MYKRDTGQQTKTKYQMTTYLPITQLFNQLPSPYQPRKDITSRMRRRTGEQTTGNHGVIRIPKWITPKETAVKTAFRTAVNLKKTMHPQKSCLDENLQNVSSKGSNSYLYS
jgi:hypothetical protein